MSEELLIEGHQEWRQCYRQLRTGNITVKLRDPEA